ncbi:hypothetical protein GCL60_09885 [Silvanigrella paludirubra]|uniref:Uncharacterized protein n=1 Tax=Silvanigrella paludirubra TaxID=2499159 RepID=A0A6N6VUC5_9BACT|nr:hypothetical protein [Silvanigrella paludirubra]KAB8039156.1 hypothetical protein GCL60_09885 [Silvanigrella paludirubra]
MRNINYSVFTDLVLNKYMDKFNDIFFQSQGGVSNINLNNLNNTYIVPVQILLNSGLCNIDLNNQLCFNSNNSFYLSFYQMVRP